MYTTQCLAHTYVLKYYGVILEKLENTDKKRRK